MTIEECVPYLDLKVCAVDVPGGSVHQIWGTLSEINYRIKLLTFRDLWALLSTGEARYYTRMDTFAISIDSMGPCKPLTPEDLYADLLQP